MALQVEAWYMDESPEDQRLPHRKNPNEPVPLEELAGLGIQYWKIDTDNWKTDETLKKIRAERGYQYEDVISCSPESLPNYDQTLKSFYEEHLHSGEEIRFVIGGSGYFDVRDKEDRWIRIHCHKGDLIIMPAGIYHRFTLDTGNFITALRMFIAQPVWTPYYRPAEDIEARKSYILQYNTPPFVA